MNLEFENIFLWQFKSWKNCKIWFTIFLKGCNCKIHGIFAVQLQKAPMSNWLCCVSELSTTMAAKPSSLLIFQPRLNLRLKPFIFSSSSLAFSIILRIPFPKASFFGNRKFHSSLSAVSSAQSTGDGGNGGGRSGALSPTLVAEELQKIDVNPPKGTRDFPPEDMRLRNWLFNNFREVPYPNCSLLCGFCVFGL